jgi:DNA replicative helicase MCM subunit Mcm2 (Cdc46/Mcm family)
VPPGRVPRQKEVVVTHDLVDCARPGDEVEITGTYVNRFEYFANMKHGFPVFSTFIEANNIKRFGDDDIIKSRHIFNGLCLVLSFFSIIYVYDKILCSYLNH